MAKQVVAISIPEEGGDTWCAVIDAAILSEEHMAVLSSGGAPSTPAERRKAQIPGCSVVWGTIIADEEGDRDVEERGDEDDDETRKTFMGERWTKIPFDIYARQPLCHCFAL